MDLLLNFGTLIDNTFSFVKLFLKSTPLLQMLLLSLSTEKHSPKTATSIKAEYDYIIVGAGTAGSVVASRLTEMPCVNVLLLEAGKPPPLLTEIPGIARLFWFTDIDWRYRTAPQKYTGNNLINRQVVWPSGKAIGGSSVLNAMLYVRGNPRNYDRWAEEGATGWSYKDVLPYFIKMEDNRDPEYVANGFHGVHGPQTVHRPRYRSEYKDPLFRTIRSLGYNVVDPNAYGNTGFYDHQAMLRSGQRCSAAKAYLVPAENRTNLDILPNAFVRKVLIENHRAVGVQFDHQGVTYEIKARREVIMSAGTVNSAQLLKLSGIGPRKELEQHKIPVIADLPVGMNLQDHPGVVTPFALNRKIQRISEKFLNPLNVAQYIQNRTGPLASSEIISAMAFLRNNAIRSEKAVPDHELYFAEFQGEAAFQFGITPQHFSQVFAPYLGRPSIICISQLLNPRSKGTVTLQSADPYDPPIIDPNYFEDARDVTDVVNGMKVCMRIGLHPIMREVISEPYRTLIPGCEQFAGNEDLYFTCSVRSAVVTFNHQVGTARMGDPHDPRTVVDPQLRVLNVKGLRVIDASVMPIVPSGNTNIPTTMVAEKASDIIKSTIKCHDEVEDVWSEIEEPGWYDKPQFYQGTPDSFEQAEKWSKITQPIQSYVEHSNANSNKMHEKLEDNPWSSVISNNKWSDALSRNGGIHTEAPKNQKFSKQIFNNFGTKLSLPNAARNISSISSNKQRAKISNTLRMQNPVNRLQEAIGKLQVSLNTQKSEMPPNTKTARRNQQSNVLLQVKNQQNKGNKNDKIRNSSESPTLEGNKQTKPTRRQRTRQRLSNLFKTNLNLNSSNPTVLSKAIQHVQMNPIRSNDQLKRPEKNPSVSNLANSQLVNPHPKNEPWNKEVSPIVPLNQEIQELKHSKLSPENQKLPQQELSKNLQVVKPENVFTFHNSNSDLWNTRSTNSQLATASPKKEVSSKKAPNVVPWNEEIQQSVVSGNLTPKHFRNQQELRSKSPNNLSSLNSKNQFNSRSNPKSNSWTTGSSNGQSVDAVSRSEVRNKAVISVTPWNEEIQSPVSSKLSALSEDLTAELLKSNQMSKLGSPHNLPLPEFENPRNLGKKLKSEPLNAELVKIQSIDVSPKNQLSNKNIPSVVPWNEQIQNPVFPKNSALLDILSNKHTKNQQKSKSDSFESLPPLESENARNSHKPNIDSWNAEVIQNQPVNIFPKNELLNKKIQDLVPWNEQIQNPTFPKATDFSRNLTSKFIGNQEISKSDSSSNLPRSKFGSPSNSRKLKIDHLKTELNKNQSVKGPPKGQLTTKNVISWKKRIQNPIFRNNTAGNLANKHTGNQQRTKSDSTNDNLPLSETEKLKINQWNAKLTNNRTRAPSKSLLKSKAIPGVVPWNQEIQTSNIDNAKIKKMSHTKLPNNLRVKSENAYNTFKKPKNNVRYPSDYELAHNKTSKVNSPKPQLGAISDLLPSNQDLEKTKIKKISRPKLPNNLRMKSKNAHNIFKNPSDSKLTNKKMYNSPRAQMETGSDVSSNNEENQQPTISNTASNIRVLDTMRNHTTRNKNITQSDLSRIVPFLQSTDLINEQQQKITKQMQKIRELTQQLFSALSANTPQNSPNIESRIDSTVLEELKNRLNTAAHDTDFCDFLLRSAKCDGNSCQKDKELSSYMYSSLCS